MRWGLWVYFMTGPIYRELIFDPSDKLAEPNGVEDARIQRLLETRIEIFRECKTSARPIEGHFYLVIAGC